MSTRPTNPVLAAAAARQPAQNLAQRADRPVACPKCGSTWFREGEFRQYSAMLFGSGAGADLRVIGNTMQTIRVCLCGFPITPNVSGVRGKTATAEGKDFMASLKGAQDILQTDNSTANIESIVEQLATRKEVTSEVSVVKLEMGKVNSAMNELKAGLRTAFDAVNVKLNKLAGKEAPAEKTTEAETPTPTSTDNASEDPKNTTPPRSTGRRTAAGRS